MAKESFDKELQLLRLMFLTSGAYNRKQLAERLGISVHTLDKTLKKLKDIQTALYQDVVDEDKREYYTDFRFKYFDVTDNFLTFLYHAKSLKESEVVRLAHILEQLNTASLSIKELLDSFLDMDIADIPDEKTLRQDMKYLEEIGAIQKSCDNRPYLYRVDSDLFTSLTDEELLDLYDFIDFMSNTQLPAVPGYILREKAKRYVNRRLQRNDFAVFLYKYHFVSRILDESQALALLQAILERKAICFRYYTPKGRKFYDSLNTNPAFQKDGSGKRVEVIPLRVIYDHQYGRWYLLAHAKGGSILRKYRVEGITQLTTGEALPAAQFDAMQAHADDRIRNSWLIDTGELVTVKLRFFSPGDKGYNFIRERVLSQGQWGKITEETEEGFLYEISVNSTQEIKPWIRSFGSSCEVLEPGYLRKEFRKEWEELRGYYESV